MFDSKQDNVNINVATIKSELRDIADHIPELASCGDPMCQLYVRTKISKGRQAVEEG